MTNNAELMRELRKRLDAQAQHQEELLAELRQLRGQGDGPPDGGREINEAIRRAGGRGAPTAHDGPTDASPMNSMNDAIRAATGRAPRKEDA